ncbi:HEPN domain-containing protein [Kitasatospora aureofaciens]|uniref:HEPN domain-containing protein n=1 Tax=Kitasatospora TaxID=2063 RepID=UPI001D2233E0|nr:HEPN domain-containing protein [Kitasatospora aureofaciens]HJD84966.1 HEPN domain-containing protein [Kitasatospora aureofaciens]
MSRWEQGRTVVDDLIHRKEVERVPASTEHAEAELAQARQHLASARMLLDVDPVGAYSLAYDAARKALAAVLVNQGLRATSRGGHVAVYETVKAQLDPPLGGILRPFSRMRVRRNESEYRSAEAPPVTPEEVRGDLPKAQAIIELAEKAMPHMGRY